MTDATATVSVEIDGPGVLAGFGSVQPDTTEVFAVATQTTYDERALVIICPTGPGTITVHGRSRRFNEIGLRKLEPWRILGVLRNGSPVAEAEAWDGRTPHPRLADGGLQRDVYARMMRWRT